MTPNELREWLLQNGVAEELEHIARITVVKEFDNFTPSFNAEELVAELDWDRLLLAGSVLSQSEAREHTVAALRIATSAILMSDKSIVRDAGAILFEKLGNHRAVALGEAREVLTDRLHERLGVSQRLEAQRRTLEHSVLLDATGQRIPVNDFQLGFWEGARERSAWMSASAPTASGKTFLVSRWLLNTLFDAGCNVAVYIAPTRALVTEVEESVRAAQKEFGANTVEVTSLPLADKYLSAVAGGSKVVFVLTQERLHLLANALDDEIKADLLVVDEAHKIGDNQRGVVLQDAIERLTRINPSLQAVFVSPATQNPAELLTDAPEGVDRKSIESDTPTVLQNVIFAEQVRRKPKEWNLRLRNGESLHDLGTLYLQSKPMGVKKQLAFIAAAVGKRGGTLVYANGAAEAEDLAHLISQLTNVVDDESEELSDLADLIRKCVHRRYRLADFVEKGVAFHYGNMPSLVRLEVERLFREGKIKFLICTSTLIEGVNLSCRTIIVRNPKKGRGIPMEPHDFWNLAGRAGRWGNEFQGNIICIKPSDTSAWPSGVPKRSKYPIQRETDAVMNEPDQLTEFLETHTSVPEDDFKTAAKYEQVAAYLLTTFLRIGTITSAPFAKRHAQADIEKIETVLAQLAGAVDIPVEVAIRHPGVSIVSLQRLLDWFRSFTGDLEDLLPAPAESDDAYDRFVSVMEIVNAKVFPAFQPPGLVPLHALIVIEWLRGFSLATIIRRRTEYHERNGQSYNIANVIRNTMELIEQTARFRAPKYLGAYLDVLKLHLIAEGREDLIDDDLDLGVALEFGVSTQTLVSLMEFGLSRISAVALYERIALDRLSQEECIAWLREREDNLEALELPNIVLREVRTKILQPNEVGVAEDGGT
ncbi:DEAD/DEAH box helicase [Ruegeria sp. HKCCD6119]|uniref:DEAD/DEAH box helicase n=1 Tax=Ruegeria sp. HKCCD6119 TaxID=2683003 RepID=UPI0014921FC7|nr:DEAD/DEAH box helicase [Ruegeria sp. HKCCD6119]NOD84306.1 DEAD/DEAH box helicase [Ruegeria sp. HKCCD6119]